MGQSHSTELTQAEIRRIFDYDPETGVATWRHRKTAYKGWGTRYAGKQAGYVNKHNGGYRVVCINDKPYPLHRLIFLWMTGRWPKADVDHINGDPADNRWENLREATRSENLRNSKRMNRNRSGFKGVSWNHSLWRARIFLNGKECVLGYFHDPAEAHEAYKAAAREHFGEFARFE